MAGKYRYAVFLNITFPQPSRGGSVYMSLSSRWKTPPAGFPLQDQPPTGTEDSDSPLTAPDASSQPQLNLHSAMNSKTSITK